MTDRAQAESGDQLAVLDGDFARAASRRERAVPLWQWGAGVAALIAAGGVGESQQGQLDSSSPDSTEVPMMVRLVNEGEFHAACALEPNCARRSGGPRSQLDLAIARYEGALAAGAGSADFLNRLSELYMAAGSIDEALTALQRSLLERPGQLAAYSKIGEAFLAAGKLDSAIHYVASALELSPERSDIHSSIGFLYLQAGRAELARVHLNTAIELDDLNPEGHRYLGLYYSHLDSVEAAIGQYERVTEILPGDLEGLNNLAFLHAGQKRYTQALDYYNKAKTLVVDAELKHAVNMNIEAIRSILSGKMRARYILVQTESEGRDILQRLNGGEDFSQLAVRFSKSPNAPDGGDLGFFGPGEMLPAVEKAVLELEVGQVSDVIAIEQGIMILQRLN